MTAPEHPVPPSFDALLPDAMARRAEEVGAAKASMPVVRTVVLAGLAGAFIALGATFSLVVAADGADRLVVGLTFSLGLVLVLVAGAELFTGNNLIVMAWASGKVKLDNLLGNWLLVYLGNFAGAWLTAWMVSATGIFETDALGRLAVGLAERKCSLGFFELLMRGVLCNALVCLAVWLSFSARTLTDKVFAIVPPIAAFVACGFEHCVANMFFLPLAGFVDDKALARHSIFVDNLLPVTLGNIIGGAVLVGMVYWLVYAATSRGED